MTLNPILHALGFDARDRVMVIHADDIGLCAATVSALDALLSCGLLTSISVMPPAPAFAEAAAYARAHTHVDAGVHLTLTSELKTDRWRPLRDVDAAAGLTDTSGYLPRTAPALATRADPSAVRDEMRAQLLCAMRAGIDVTHLDTHMFTSFQPQFLPHYLALAGEFHLPALLPRFDVADNGLNLRACGLEGATLAHAARIVAEWEAQPDSSLIAFDRVALLPLNQPEERVAQAKKVFDAAPAGLTHFLIHPAMDTPELRAVAPDGWRARIADYEAFTCDELRRHVRDSGIRLIGYRHLRAALRRVLPEAPTAHAQQGAMI